MIADEIMVGCGRSGTFFAHDQADIKPNFLCLSKSITGGYLPLSVVMTTDAVYGAFYDDNVARGFLHSHSYTGNALACRAALATLELFERDNVIDRNREKTSHLSAAAKEISEHPRVKHFRNTGMIWAFDVECHDSAFARKFYQAALNHELLLRPIGNTVYFMPPYIIDNDEMRLLVKRTLETINALPT